mmetsp:Transcript_55409/g.124537  ORF Transcript_55409/g.124537 Transcript_55409/m.124537 type:complete len:526 (+) Transcript_55409:78-1655(+)
MPTNLAHQALQSQAVAFYEVKCANGFTCVSNVHSFGLKHDGEFLGTPDSLTLLSRYSNPDTFEVGCPARGSVNDDGHCQDYGEGDKRMCWANDRYEAGAGKPCDDPNKCLCVDLNSNTGWRKAVGKVNVGPNVRNIIPTGREWPEADTTVVPTKTNRKKKLIRDRTSQWPVKAISHSDNGQELRSGEWLVQPEHKCRECSQHECNEQACNACPNCEFRSEAVGNKTAAGCYDRDGGELSRRRAEGVGARIFRFGIKPLERKLAIIPHYALWDPGHALSLEKAANGMKRDQSMGAAGFNDARMPWEPQPDPSSREAWLLNYKQFAPRVQHVMDEAAERVLLKGQLARSLSCGDDELGIDGDGIQDEIETWQSLQRSCKQMQSTADSLEQGAPFEQIVPKGVGGVQQLKVKCRETLGDRCEGLNCYVNDREIERQVEHLRWRSAQCRAIAEMHRVEEVKNGPPPKVLGDLPEPGEHETIPPLPGPSIGSMGGAVAVILPQMRSSCTCRAKWHWQRCQPSKRRWQNFF